MRALLLLLLLSPAQAEPYGHEGFFIGASGTLGFFSQEDHAPPICCGERDEWTALGAGATVQLGLQSEGWARTTVDVGYARLSARSQEEVDLALDRVGLGLYLEAVARPDYASTLFRAGAGLVAETVSGDADGASVSETVIGAALRLGATRAVAENFDLGGDLTLAKHFANHSVGFAFTATWFPLRD